MSPLDFSSVGCTGSRHAPGHSVAWLDYSVPGGHDFILWPQWLYFSHVVRRYYLSCDNTASTSSTSSFGRIASTTHLD
jgi:hypothetical protein